MSRAFRLGVFIVVALLIFGVAGVFWIGKNQMLFQSRYRLNAEFQSVAGLAGGASVRVAGIQKGNGPAYRPSQTPGSESASRNGA